MKEKFKRIISLLLAVTIMSGTGIMAAADEVVENTTVTASVDTAENDKWYQEAIGFLAYLGIFQGDENGDMKPEEAVSRAEIAAIILREMNISNMSAYRDTFNDVDTSHWAADVIQTAYDNGIINGYEDGSFGPDEDVTYEQAVKMIMCAINYEALSLANGGYPMGYIKVAEQYDVNDHTKATIGQPITRRTVAKLVYNSLIAPYPTVSGSQNNALNYTTTDGVTILSEKRDIYYTEGTLTAAPGKSIDLSMVLLDGQVAIEDEIIPSEMVNPEQYVAQYVRLFYRDESGNGNDSVAVYAVELTDKTESMLLEASDIEKLTTGYEGGKARITYYVDGKTKQLELKEQPIIVYNDNPFTMANFAKLDLQDSDGNAIGFDDFITPDEGTIKAVDFAKDGEFDILFVENYETSVVKVATALRMQLEYPVSIGDMIKLDTASNPDLHVKVTRDGDEAELRDLAEGDVVSIRMNANYADETYTGDKYITIDAWTDYVEGTVKSLYEDDNGDYVAKIDDEDYKVIDNKIVLGDIKSLMGSKGKFRLNKFGTIAKAEGNIIGGLASNEKYGWLVNVYQDESGEDVIARVYTSDGELKNFPLASKVDYWAPDATSNAQVSAKDIDSYIDFTEKGNEYFLNVEAKDAGTVAMRLCKFRTNARGEINRLYLAVDDTTVDEHSNALRVAVTDQKGNNTSTGLWVGKYYIDEGMPQLTVPLTFADVNDSSSYSYRVVGSSEFADIVGEEYLEYNCFFVDVTDFAPGITVRMEESSSAPVPLTDYMTADDNSVILISSINVGVNEDDEEIYIIKGYRDGKLSEYTLAENVLVAQVNEKPFPDGATNEYYDARTVWTKDMDIPLTDVLHVGDICGIAGTTSNVGVVMRMVDTRGLVDYITDGGTMGDVQEGQFRYDEMFSPTRDRITFGYVTDVRTSPIVQYDMLVDGSTGVANVEDMVTMGVKDLGRAVQFINVSSSGKISIDKEVSDPYEVEAGDYVFMRSFKNDAARELFVIRFEG